jgi:hypothetical protein
MLILLPVFRAAGAADFDLKPGDTVGPHNWEKVKEMVGENLLRRIKEGYSFKIKEAKTLKPPKEYLEATEKYSSRVRLGRNGELLGYTAGLPFPHFNPNDPQAGIKLAWNFYWRWLGDDFRNGGATKEGKIIRYAIEKNGSERRADVMHLYIQTRNRVSLEPKPVIPGYEHIDWMTIRADEYPRDTAGTTTLEIRYTDPKREDEVYIYVPSIRRVRLAPPIQRCATIAPSEFNFDDIHSFNGKLTNFNYKFMGERKMLGNVSQEKLPFRRSQGDYLPLDEAWEVHDVYVLEITPKNPDYCYPKKVLYIDKNHFEGIWTMIWDSRQNYWKEQFGFRSTVKLPDGREALSVSTVVMVNVQNGRSTLVTVSRGYNQGYQPTLFTLGTLQQVLRGGAIR